MVQNEVEDNRRLLMPSVALRAFDPKQRALIGFKSSFRQRVRYGFRIDSLGFLIEANTVSEVVEEPTVYPIPQTPSWLVGLINLRGNLVPVFDLRLSLRLGNAAQGKYYLLLLGEGEDMVSFFVENLPQPVNTAHKLVHPPPLPAALRGYTTDVYSSDKIIWVEFDHRGFFQSLAAAASATES